jgi:hypothetical protein
MALRKWVTRGGADGTNGQTGPSTAEREELTPYSARTGSYRYPSAA